MERIQKIIAESGYCSRRKAEELILKGKVKLNGITIKELGTKASYDDEITIDGNVISSKEEKEYYLLYKPEKTISSVKDEAERDTVTDYIDTTSRIYPVGRLDYNTTGILLLTNDGDMAAKLTHPRFLKKKVYHVVLDKNVTLHDMQKIADGLELEDGPIKVDAVEYAHQTDKKQVGIEIHSGKNRIVRRIFESLGYRVIKLDRVQFCGLTKKNLRRGDWRFLTEKEVDMLRMGAFE
jgi:23S rRNA pseudouridine2605 synthase